MTKTLGTPILMTDDFVTASQTHRALPLGENSLAGVGNPILLHTLDSVV